MRPAGGRLWGARREADDCPGKEKGLTSHELSAMESRAPSCYCLLPRAAPIGEPCQREKHKPTRSCSSTAFGR